jgi:hypothetical protein
MASNGASCTRNADHALVLCAFVYRLKSSPAAFVGLVYAEDEESAIAVAIEEHRIRPADRKRFTARPR